MKNMLNKKNILILVIIIVVVIVISLVIYFFTKGENKYPDQPIEQKSLTSSDLNIGVNKFVEPKDSKYFLWTVSNSVKLNSVQKMVQSLSSNFELVDSEEGVYYNWKNGTDEILYDTLKNYLLFNHSEGILMDEAEINANVFSKFVKNFFDVDWQYNVFKNEKGSNGETIYYAKRILEENINIEVREHNQQTDYLAMKNGKIIYGKLLLTEFEKTDIQLPLITSQQLIQYINADEYPKEIYPQLNALRDSLLKEIDYLSEDLEEVLNTLKNCESTSSDLIYYYKSFDQKYLTPVYKLDALCEVSYEDEVYSIPAIAYVNAIDPQYVYIPE